MPESIFVAGLDLGQTTDYSALCVGEIKPNAGSFALNMRHLSRFPKQTPYPVQVASVADTIGQVREMGRVLLVVDQTGVGRPVVDMFRMARMLIPIWPVTIAGSQMGKAKRNEETGDWTVPKKDLIGALVALVHGKRFAVSNQIDRELLRVWQEEMANFTMKITAAGNTTMEAWREGQHDDVVLAASLMAWAANRWVSPGGVR